MSSKSSPYREQEYGMVVSASAMGAVLLVSGFCWIFYCICHPQNRIARANAWNAAGRRPNIASIGMVPGDEHGQYYTGRNPQIYRDIESFTRVPTPAPTRLSPFSAFHFPFRNNPSGWQENPTLHVAHSQLVSDDPPPYPGELDKVISASHSPVKLPLPPPYSA